MNLVEQGTPTGTAFFVVVRTSGGRVRRVWRRRAAVREPAQETGERPARGAVSANSAQIGAPGVR